MSKKTTINVKKMDERTPTTRSMERRANHVKRFVINIMKLFRLCGKKKHKKTDDCEDKPFKREDIIA